MLAQPVVLWFRHRVIGHSRTQHLLSMNFAISSGEEKVTAARSPSIPVGMIAGAPLSGPILVGIGHETQIVLPEGARLAVAHDNAISVVAIGNRLDLFHRLHGFQLGVVPAAHHSP
jgi:hypothetical protein